MTSATSRAAFRKSVYHRHDVAATERHRSPVPGIAAQLGACERLDGAVKFAIVRKSKANSVTKLTRKRVKRKIGIGESFEGLVELQARLRAPGGCPWDREQSHESLRPFLLEEAYEVLESLEGGDPEKFASELGDLLLQVVFHAQLAKEAGKFEIRDVTEGIQAKLIRRHPHVFGKAKARDVAQVLKNWEQIKAEERQSSNGREKKVEHAESLLDGVPRSLPALLEAYQLTRRAANIGFDWEKVSGVIEKLGEETRELERVLATRNNEKAAPRMREVEAEVGDLLFVAVNLARFLGVDPEVALKKANRKFTERFKFMEQEMARQGRRLAEAPREEMESLWEQSKRRA